MLLLLLALLGAEAGAQSAEDGFDPGANAAPLALAVQADGKILVGGGFTALGGGGAGTTARNRIGRLNPDGTLDSGFNPGANLTVYSFAVQTDGKILVGGTFTTFGGGGTGTSTRNRIARLSPDGSLDTAFNPGANGGVYAVALQPDGRILVAGAFTALGGGTGTSTRNRIGRLNPDGSLDTSFNPGANNDIYMLAVQADGKILVVGNFTTIGGGGSGMTTRNYIARLNPNGSVDTSFNPGANAFANAIALSTDGKILVAGGFSTLGGGGTGNTARSRIGRLNPDGSLDPGFNPAVNAGINALAVQADGKILLGGSFTNLAGAIRNNIGRLRHDGTLDSSFNPGANATVYALAEQADGDILAVGSFTTLGGGGTGSAPRSKIARLYPDGTVDATCDPGANLFGVYTLAVQPDGKIVVGGHFDTLGGGGSGTATRYNLGRLKPDGSLDAGFDTGTNGPVRALVTQSDGKVIVSGSFNLVFGNGTGPYQREFIARFNQDGTVDAGFNPGANDEINTIALQSDGKILLGGSFTTLGGGGSGVTTRNYIGRLNPDGSLDTSFDPGANSAVLAVALQADGKILIGGTFATLGGGGIGNNVRHHIGRLNPDGTIDSAFNPGADADVYTFVTQADGKILVAGSFNQLAGNSRSRFGRLHADGSIDAGFDSGTNSSNTGLTVQSDGRILLAGGNFFFERRNADGTVDSGFTADVSARVDALTLQANGKIMAVGAFSFLSGGGGGMTSRRHIGRLTNPTPAFQSVDVSSAGTTITWNRSGASPELAYATFELSNDAINYTALPHPVRVSSGWQLDGLSLPTQQNLFIRARGFYSTSWNNRSGSIVETVRNVFLSPSLTPTQVVSRKLHNGAAFDINLPLTGNSGVECRSGGASNNYQVVLTFPSAVTFTSAVLSAGTGSVNGSSGSGTTTVTVSLTGVINAQRITVTLFGVNNGVTTGNVSVPMGVLLGDANGDTVVNAGDATITRNRSGQIPNATNFRSDHNVDGFINAADTTIVRARSGHFIP